MKGLVLALALWGSASAATLTDVTRGVQGASQEVVAYLPSLRDGTVAKLLGDAARRGLRVWVFTTPQAVMDAGSWSVSVGHAPGVRTYFVPGGGLPFIETDASWGVTGALLDDDRPGQGPLTVVQGSALAPYLTWAGQVTKLGQPVPPVELVRLRYHLK